MICTSKTFSIHTVEGFTFLTMRPLILLFVIELFAAVISAQVDTEYYPNQMQNYPDQIQYSDETQYHPDETQYYPDESKYNPDKPLVVPPI